jgi:mono/diheme cytochrome c family protein
MNSLAETRTSARRAGRARLAGVLLVGLSLAGCRQDMHDAPRYDPLEASTLLPGGTSAQPFVEGTVARGHLNDDELLYTGKVSGQPSADFPFAITKTDMDRGEERYNIYCAPCHDRTGNGNGMVVQRGFPQAASYHIDRLRQAPAGYIFDVITNGFGRMPDYKAQIEPADRWRIVAYIRALQLAHAATADDVPPAEMEKLQNPAPAAPAATEAPAGEAGHAGGGE